MILARRKIHFFTFVALAILLPLCFLAGIGLRPNYIEVSPQSDDLFQKAGVVLTETEDEDNPFTTVEENNYSLKYKQFFDPRRNLVLILQPIKPLLIADPLLYWHRSEVPPKELTSASILLGNLSGTSQKRYLLPSKTQGKKAYLVLYSQAQQEVSLAIPFEAKTIESQTKE